MHPITIPSAAPMLNIRMFQGRKRMFMRIQQILLSDSLKYARRCIRVALKKNPTNSTIEMIGLNNIRAIR
jgi:hypothetical protein